jgi:poly(3-hydroxybutyrate) depolymerase
MHPADAAPDPTGYYHSGATTVFAYGADQRFSYCLYLPERTDTGDAMPLVVLVHGTERGNAAYRDAFASFAERHGCAVLAPLFPAGIDDPEDLHNYKFIAYHGIRYDRVLLGMVDEVAARYPVDGSRFCLHGFSGGGQFTHRFLYLHPDRLAAASIGAPGRITRLDGDQPWWLGTRGFAEEFGQGIDLAALARVPVQMVVGDRDTDTWEITNPGGTNWMDGAEKTGRTRIERLRTLQADFEEHGVAVRFDLVPGVAHSGTGVLDAVRGFFSDVLTGPAVAP